MKEIFKYKNNEYVCFTSPEESVAYFKATRNEIDNCTEVGVAVFCKNNNLLYCIQEPNADIYKMDFERVERGYLWHNFQGVDNGLAELYNNYKMSQASESDYWCDKVEKIWFSDPDVVLKDNNPYGQDNAIEYPYDIFTVKALTKNDADNYYKLSDFSKDIILGHSFVEKLIEYYKDFADATLLQAIAEALYEESHVLYWDEFWELEGVFEDELYFSIKPVSEIADWIEATLDCWADCGDCYYDEKSKCFKMYDNE